MDNFKNSFESMSVYESMKVNYFRGLDWMLTIYIYGETI